MSTSPSEHTKSIEEAPEKSKDRAPGPSVSRGGPKKDPSSTVFSQSLPIPEHKIGWIIGIQGRYMRQLAEKSGAAISISESTSREYGTVWKYVQITGTSRAVDRAKKLLYIRLDRWKPRPDESKSEDVDTTLSAAAADMTVDMPYDALDGEA
jgi:KH domain